MRNDNRRALPVSLFERVENHRLGMRINRREGIIENQHRRIAEQRPRDRYALSLAAGEGYTALANHGVVLLIEALDRFVNRGDGRAFNDFRIVSDMIAALLANNSPTEGVGHKPIELCTVMTDGSVEAHDVLRIAGDGFTQTKFNLFEHAIDDVRNEPRWKAARDASINLSQKCRSCKFMNACGGGYLPHRFSRRNGYDNPSVYCDDLYSMFENMQSVLAGHLYVSKPDGGRVDLRDALAGA